MRKAIIASLLALASAGCVSVETAEGLKATRFTLTGSGLTVKQGKEGTVSVEASEGDSSAAEALMNILRRVPAG